MAIDAVTLALAKKFATSITQDKINQSVSDYITENPEALDQAAVESIVGDELLEQDTKIARIQNAIQDLEAGSLSALGATNGQVPTADGDGSWEWATPGGDGGAVQDVQVNGVSVLSDGVANVPLGTGSKPGVVQGYPAGGTQILSDGKICVAPASEEEIKSGASSYKPTAQNRQHIATFYGLAKAAGDATQSASDNAVGNYTEEAKAAIRAMLGVTVTPDNYALNGTDLKTVFADADALYDAYSAENYSRIHVGDYWPVTLNGEYWDYGNGTCPSGVTYYSDTEMTAEAGTTESDYDADFVGDAQLPYGLKPYCTIKINNVTYYVARDDCLDHRVQTLSNAQMYFVVGGINQYWRYGDSGANNFQNGRPHLLMEARDGLPHTLKMRKQNEAWEGTHIATFTGDGTTAEFTIDGTVGTIGYVWVNGTRKAYNTDYTYGSDKITFKSGKIPAADAEIEVEWMDGKTPWTGSAIYHTFNDPDHGILPLIQAADEKLYNHMYKGPNGTGMRYYGETRTKTNQQSGTWENRGILFLPTEDEIWGRLIYSTGASASVNQQQWPIYSNGGRRQYAKGAGNGASRANVWCASSTSVTSFAGVDSNGYPSYNGAYHALAAAPCFLLS